MLIRFCFIPGCHHIKLPKKMAINNKSVKIFAVLKLFTEAAEILWAPTENTFPDCSSFTLMLEEPDITMKYHMKFTNYSWAVHTS